MISMTCYDYSCHSANVLSSHQGPGSEVNSSRGRRLAFWAWSALSPDSHTSETKKHWAMVEVGALAAAITFCCLLLLAALLTYFYQRNKKRSKRRDLEFELVERVPRLRARLGATEYSYQQLHTATRGFSKQFQLGSGGFCTVYLGILPDNTTIAVKRPNERCSGGTSSKLFTEQFENEINILSQVNHRNLVELLGFCKCKGKLPLLVYEYVPNGTLADHLHSKSSLLSSWRLRLDIAIQTAEGLCYLHAAASPPIYHRDIKSSNILLDNKLNVKVADFGISKLVPMDVSHVYTGVQGTLGYLDPEYFRSCHYTDKSDVYSFGMVLLELVTGQKAIDNSRRTSNIKLAMMSNSAIKLDMVLSIVDPKLVVAAAETVGVLESIAEVVKLALNCMGISREGRPNMKQVLQQLQSIEGLLIGQLQDSKSKYKTPSQLKPHQPSPVRISWKGTDPRTMIGN